jgi:hypothetical protein
MALTLYKVDLPSICGIQVVDQKKSCLVWANSSADALKQVAAARDGDVDATWLAGTATALTTPTDYVGWIFSIHLVTHAITASYTAIAADTIDLIGAGLVLALNATAIDHAAYTAGTNTLRVAQGSSDAMGDDTFTVTVTPPSGFFPTGYVFDDTVFYASKVQGGLSSADLSVVLLDVLPGGAQFIAG